MTSVPEGIFSRTELLLGSEKMDRLASAKVILFGVGGVGSWCAEGLIRSGIGHLTIVDSDRVDVTNINRQLMATTGLTRWSLCLRPMPQSPGRKARMPLRTKW